MNENISKLSEILVNKFDGMVPKDLKELEKLLKLNINVDHINLDTFKQKSNFFSYRRSQKLGDDDYGKLAINKLKKDNIDTSNIIISNKHKTGVAGIHVDRNTGKNAITVVRGAPSSLTTKEIDINLIKQSKIFLSFYYFLPHP